MPAQVAAALPVIRERCEEIGRDPTSLKVSVYIWGAPADVRPGSERVERLLEFAELGLDLAIVQGYFGTTDPAGLDALIEDCQATGCCTRVDRVNRFYTALTSAPVGADPCG